VIYTSSGFYILKVLEKKSLKYKIFEDLIDLIREKVFQEKSEKLYKEWMYNIKTSSFIELRI
jgi:parvulin-like peptidyl-prolyl isomerase